MPEDIKLTKKEVQQFIRWRAADEACRKIIRDRAKIAKGNAKIWDEVVNKYDLDTESFKWEYQYHSSTLRAIPILKEPAGPKQSPTRNSISR